MKRFYKIEEDYILIELSATIYPIVSVEKAVSLFLEKAYVKIEEEENKIVIKIKLKELNNNSEQLIGEFYNELLRESLRYNIAKETKNLRELIVGRALYTTCIETEKTENEEEFEENYSLDDIAVNWFDENGEK